MQISFHFNCSFLEIIFELFLHLFLDVLLLTKLLLFELFLEAGDLGVADVLIDIDFVVQVLHFMIELSMLAFQFGFKNSSLAEVRKVIKLLRPVPIIWMGLVVRI